MSSFHYRPPTPPYNGGAQQPPPKPNQKILSLLLKSIIMTIVTLFFFIFLGVAAILFLLATVAVHRHSTPPSVSSNGLSRKEVKRLPQFKFFKRANFANNECVICLEGIKQGQWCRKLVGCGHMFHKKCLDTWLYKVANCPVCRTMVKVECSVQDRSLLGYGWRNDFRVC